MKLSKKAEKAVGGSLNLKQPGNNHLARILLMFLVIGVAIGLISWVGSIGKKAEETIGVCMLSRAVHKNQMITEELIVEYKMLVGEFEKYAVVSDNGTTKKRIVPWTERNRLVGSFAAYPLQGNTVAMFNNFITSRIDNTDTVLYSFPGKEIIKLDVANDTVGSFKTFLQPGDRLNIYIIYKEIYTEWVTDEYGSKYEKEYEMFKTDLLFGDIMIADLLNKESNSILDIYTAYNQMNTWQQAKLDGDATFQKSVTPNALLVALTPEERDRYLYYSAKKDVEFKVTLPQRVE